jgi:hypothetical protein
MKNILERKQYLVGMQISIYDMQQQQQQQQQQQVAE